MLLQAFVSNVFHREDCDTVIHSWHTRYVNHYLSLSTSDSGDLGGIPKEH